MWMPDLCSPFVGRQLQVGLETWMPRELAAAAAAAAAAEQAMPAAE